MPMRHIHRMKTGIQSRPYFFITFLLTALLYIVIRLISEWHWSSAVLLSWNISVFIYLSITMKMLWSTTQQHILKRAQQQERNQCGASAVWLWTPDGPWQWLCLPAPGSDVPVQEIQHLLQSVRLYAWYDAEALHQRLLRGP
jgi:hypothetical protein